MSLFYLGIHPSYSYIMSDNKSKEALRKMKSDLKSLVPKICATTAVIYTVKRWNIVPVGYAKPTYIFLLSPLLLTEALWNNDSICYQYKRSLMYLTYPDCKMTPDKKYRKCSDVHNPEKSCRDAFIKNSVITISRALKMYSKFYIFQALFALVLTCRSRERAKVIIRTALVNTLRSSLFISGQTILQRLLLCGSSAYHINITPWKLYLMSVIGSIPILLERSFRTQQLNSLIISHLIVGQMKKRKITTPLVPLGFFLSTYAADRFQILRIPFTVSLATAFTFL